ncbi:MAG: hypothetical protein AB8B86_18715 [Pseudomonadales bacterium]
MNGLPSKVADYVDKLLIAEYPAYFLVDENALVLECGGALSHYGLQESPYESYVAESIPVLEGVVSVSGPLVLPYIQLQNNRYADIHFFDDASNRWVVFIDSSSEGADQQHFQQRFLSRTLAHEDFENLTMDNDLTAWRVLSQLEMAMYERQANGGFRIVGEIPAWLQVVACESIADGWCWPEQHPFMSAFLASLGKCWTDKFTRPVRSNVWTENGTDGELYLQMVAVTTHQKQLLILERLSRSRAEQSINAQRSNDTRLFHESMDRMQRSTSASG